MIGVSLPVCYSFCSDFGLVSHCVEQQVPEEWRDALHVPIPKKGDLIHCDNWRGISLLDVMV